MSTPSIQTLITQAQQVLNLKSTNEIRATLAAVLANANVGTPLNPSLTTQQLWDEFYEIVRQPSDDIMSIITDQMMRMVFSPPAPGGAGANTQVIFNDGGVLAGDAGLVYNKTTDALTVAGLVTAGSATITGDLTVATNTLKTTSGNVGIGTVTPDIFSRFYTRTIGFNSTGSTVMQVNGSSYGGIDIGAAGVRTFGITASGTDANISTVTNIPMIFNINGSTAMTLNSTGLAIGGTALDKLTVVGNSFFRGAAAGVRIGDGGGYGYISAYDQTLSTAKDLVLQTGGGNVGVGVTPSTAWNTGANLQVGSMAALYSNSSLGAVDLSSNSIRTNNDTYQYFLAGSNQASRFQQRDGTFRFFNAPAGTSPNVITFGDPKMTLDASGNLLVGTTTQPSGVTGSKGTFKSTASDWSSVVWNSNATPFGLRIQHDTDVNGSSSQFLFCYGGSTTRAEIRSNGGLANFSANNVNLSDIRTKTDIKPLTSYWNKIKALELVTFKYKDQTHNDDNIGLISQQVESVAPEFVSNDGFGETPVDGIPLKAIYTTDLYHAAIKALQEAMTRIEVLEAKLA